MIESQALGSGPITPPQLVSTTAAVGVGTDGAVAAATTTVVPATVAEGEVTTTTTTATAGARREHGGSTAVARRFADLRELSAAAPAVASLVLERRAWHVLVDDRQVIQQTAGMLRAARVVPVVREVVEYRGCTCDGLVEAVGPTLRW